MMQGANKKERWLREKRKKIEKNVILHLNVKKKKIDFLNFAAI